MDEGFITENSRILDSIITAVSGAVETHMGRYVESTERTAYVDVLSPGQRKIMLRGYPISSISSLYEDSSRSFGSDSSVDSDLYELGTQGKNMGRVSFDYDLTVGDGVLKVTYTGGMAASASAFISAYPSLALAVEKQVWFDWKHKDMAGLDSADGGQISGGARRQVQSLDWLNGWGNLIPDLVQEIKIHRSMVQRW